MDNFDPDYSMRYVYLGETGTGKTHQLINHLDLQKRAYPDTFNILICPSYENNKAWNAYKSVPGHNKKLIDVWIKQADEKALQYLEHLVGRRKKMNNKIVNLIIDDCGKNPNIKNKIKGNVFPELANNASHYNINLYSINQFTTQLLTELQNGQFQIAVLTFQSAIEERKKIRKIMLGFLEDEQAEKVLIDGWQKKYDLILVDKRDPYNIKVLRNYKENIKPKNIML